MPSVIPTHFEPPPTDNFPFPAPFILSSMEKEWCRLQTDTPAAVIFIKRRHLEENLKTLEQEIGMSGAERTKFLDYWCARSNRDRSEIRAERDEYFDLRQKAMSWMERARTANQQQKSRLEKYAESAQMFYQNVQDKAIPPSPAGTQGFGYADIPDEQ